MRQQHIEHLGQVKKLYLEATGEISVFFYEKEQVRPGMPILPEILAKPFQGIVEKGRMRAKSVVNSNNIYPGNSTSVETAKIIYG